MKRLFFLFSWTLCVTGASLTCVAIYQISQAKSASIHRVVATETKQVIALPQEAMPTQTATDVVEIEDARSESIKQFITRHNPKLLEEAPEFHEQLVSIADREGLDYRLLPAIAMNESGLCRVIPENSFNCLGLGVHSQGTWHFSSYEENFATAAAILKKNYIDRGLVTPELIMTKYTPNSPNGAWAKAVNQFMNEIRYNDRLLGIQAEDENHALEFALPPAE